MTVAPRGGVGARSVPHDVREPSRASQVFIPPRKWDRLSPLSTTGKRDCVTKLKLSFPAEYPAASEFKGRPRTNRRYPDLLSPCLALPDACSVTRSIGRIAKTPNEAITRQRHDRPKPRSSVIQDACDWLGTTPAGTMLAIRPHLQCHGGISAATEPQEWDTCCVRSERFRTTARGPRVM